MFRGDMAAGSRAGRLSVHARGPISRPPGLRSASRPARHLAHVRRAHGASESARRVRVPWGFPREGRWTGHLGR